MCLSGGVLFLAYHYYHCINYMRTVYLAYARIIVYGSSRPINCSRRPASSSSQPSSARRLSTLLLLSAPPSLMICDLLPLIFYCLSLSCCHSFSCVSLSPPLFASSVHPSLSASFASSLALLLLRVLLLVLSCSCPCTGCSGARVVDCKRPEAEAAGGGSGADGGASGSGGRGGRWRGGSICGGWCSLRRVATARLFSQRLDAARARGRAGRSCRGLCTARGADRR